MQTNVQKWGNSLALRIPAQFSKLLSLKPGTPVEIIANDKQLLIKPANQYDLDALLDKITPENIHHEIFPSDKNRGEETW